MCHPFQAKVSCDPLGFTPDHDSLDGVEEINHYAMFMGYVSMAIRGLRYLVLTWTTVVLLGGFVSMLQKKDFWALTVITLAQTFGVFNVSPKERLKNIKDSFMGLLVSMFHREAGTGKLVALLAATLLQALVVAVLLFPLGAVYVFGLCISTGISLWRLIQRDYGVVDGDPSKANLRPALDILYLLPLVQGALLCYRAIFSVSKRDKVVVNRTLERYKSDEDMGQSVWDYFNETMAGCEKDPSFARGRNLITYAVDLMASTPTQSYLSGARILDALLGHCWYEPSGHTMQEQRPRLRGVVAKVLLESASSTQLIWKLLRSLDGTLPCDETPRARAARILEHLGSDIHLQQFPEGVQCIVPPLDAFRSGCGPWEEALQGLRILRRLATNSANLRAIRGMDTSRQLHKIMAPLTNSHRPLHPDHNAWPSVAWESLILIRWLMDAKLLKSDDTSGVIIAINFILHCDKCDDSLQEEAMRILVHHLPWFESANDNFDWAEGDLWLSMPYKLKLFAVLIGVFAQGKKNYCRALAGDNLEMLSSEGESNARIVLKGKYAVASLTGILVDARDSDLGYRIQAARILKNLCSYSYINDEYGCLERLKKAMTDAVPKVLREILEIQAGLQAVTETYGVWFSAQGVDLEEGRISQDVGSLNLQQQHKAIELQQALLLECVTACDKLIGDDQGMANQFDEIAAQICSEARQPVRNWAALVREAGEILKDPSFARGRSLITYAGNLMASTSSESYLSGAKILDTLLGHCSYEPFGHMVQEQRPRLCIIAANLLLGSESGTRLIWNLLRMLDLTVTCGEEERARAARLLEHLGGNDHLAHFAEGLQCIVPLLESSTMCSPRWAEVLQGMRILRRLATTHGNLEAIRGTPGLLAKITAPLDYHHVLHPDHAAWSTVAWESLILVRRLLDAKLLSQGAKQETISAVRAMTDIFRCGECNDSLKKEAIWILAHVYWDVDGGLGQYFSTDQDECRKKFIALLIDVFAGSTKNYSRVLAGEKLETLSSEGFWNAKIILEAHGDVVASLTKILVDGRQEYGHRIQAARILKNLCGHCCTDDAEAFSELKDAMTDAVPKVLREILDTQAVKELEECRVSQDVGGLKAEQQGKDVELQEALLSECAAACDKWVKVNQILAHQLDEIAGQICSDIGKPVIRSWAAIVREARGALKQKEAPLPQPL